MTRRSSKPLYAPLDETRNEIRLLELVSCSKTVRPLVECNMITCSLNDSPRYQALSYVWGDPNDTHKIRVNGQDVQVTRNLVDALLQLREDNQVQILWVDALCNNQEDTKEKENQVQKMGNIFSGAYLVVGWIGIGDETSPTGIQNMKALAKVAGSLRIGNVWDPSPALMSGEERRHVGQKVFWSLCRDVKPLKGAVGSIILLLQRPYWTRLWIIQEICLSSAAILACGSDNVQWRDVEAAFGILLWMRMMVERTPSDDAMLTEVYHPFPRQKLQLPAVATLCARFMVEDCSGLGLADMLPALCHGSDLDATVPHDRVYGLLGLMTTKDRHSIKIDYGSPHTTLFADTTLRLLNKYGPEILMYCGLSNQCDKNPALPSWAIDFTNTAVKAEHLVGAALFEDDKPIPGLFAEEMSQDQLVVRAAAVDRVAGVVPYSGKPHHLYAVVISIAHLVQRQQKLERESVWRSILGSLLYLTMTAELEGYCLALVEAFYEMRIPEEPSDHDEQNATQEIPRPPWPPVPSYLRSIKQPHLVRRLLWNESPRALFVTEYGRIGSGPVVTQVGDSIVALPEWRFPFLIRPAGKERDVISWKLVGPTWLEGITIRDDDADEEPDMRKFWETERDLEEIVLS